VLATLAGAGHDVVDLGTDTDAVRIDPTPTRRASSGRQAARQRGILVCGSGVGASVAASRCAASARRSATSLRHQGVRHDDRNVLCLGSEGVGPSLAADLVRTFLGAEFDGGERYVERLKKVEAMEREMRNG
jgi:ribose 5-phosphate isomerase B